MALEKASRKPYATDIIERDPWSVTAATPGGVYRMTKDRWKTQMFGHGLCDCLILDEASQMNLPEAVMAALLLKTQGQLVVVGDHRQMPPIIKHDWENESRRTFAEYRSYESLFLTLMTLAPPMVQFAESFRLHAAMATFLRREIYAKDGIPYFSRRHKMLESYVTGDPFVDAVLDPQHPLTVVVHGEERSQTRNLFEQMLITPILETLAAPPFNLGPVDGHWRRRAPSGTARGVTRSDSSADAPRPKWDDHAFGSRYR